MDKTSESDNRDLVRRYFNDPAFHHRVMIVRQCLLDPQPTHLD
jgi:hypothetical protein